MDLYPNVTDESLIAMANIILLNYRVGGYYVPDDNRFCIHCHGFKTDNPTIIIHYGAMEEPQPIAVFTKDAVLYPWKKPGDVRGFSRTLFESLLGFLTEATKAKMKEIEKVLYSPMAITAPAGFCAQKKD